MTNSDTRNATTEEDAEFQEQLMNALDEACCKANGDPDAAANLFSSAVENNPLLKKADARKIKATISAIAEIRGERAELEQRIIDFERELASLLKDEFTTVGEAFSLEELTALAMQHGLTLDDLRQAPFLNMKPLPGRSH